MTNTRATSARTPAAKTSERHAPRAIDRLVPRHEDEPAIEEAAATPEEERELDEADPPEVAFDGEESRADDDDVDADPPAGSDATHAIPEWARMPADLKPPEGVVVGFLRIKAEMCRIPADGDHDCVVWPLDEIEEIRAYERARGSKARSVYELAKGCLRAVDGQKVRWDRGAREISGFWHAIGAKGRALVINYYSKQHNVSEEESLDFFSNHSAFVTAQRA